MGPLVVGADRAFLLVQVDDNIVHGWLSRAPVSACSLTGAAAGAHLIDLEGIIGAFVAGLALNYAGQRDLAARQVEAIGHGLFIPAFFFAIGFLVDVPTFATTLVRQPALVAAVVGGLVAAKLARRRARGRAWGYDRASVLMMWSLSLPQVAATLATALVAFEARGEGGLG